MKVVFFGTPDYVTQILAALHKKFNSPKNRQLIAVVTQPPREVGRKKKIERSAVDHWAYKHKIEIITEFEDIPNADLGIVAAYGKIIPDFVIKKFSLGLLNIHPSLLPQLRGASPTQAALILGLQQTGVSIIKMDSQMDHGPIVTQFKADIRPDDTNETLRQRLFELTVPVLMELLSAYVAGKIKLKEQDHSKATFTTTLSREDGFIPGEYIKAALEGTELELLEEWNVKFISQSIKVSPETIESFMRALNPDPGVWTQVTIIGKDNQALKRSLKLLSGHLEPLSENPHNLNNKLVPDLVQLEGRNPVTWGQFRQGYKGFRF